MKQVQFIARTNGWNDNVAGTVLVTKSDSSEVTEEQLIKALEVKYDTLRDKLLSEVSKTPGPNFIMLLKGTGHYR